MELGNEIQSTINQEPKNVFHETAVGDPVVARTPEVHVPSAREAALRELRELTGGNSGDREISQVISRLNTPKNEKVGGLRELLGTLKAELKTIISRIKHVMKSDTSNDIPVGRIDHSIQLVRIVNGGNVLEVKPGISNQENQLSPEQIADRLVNYETGEITSENIDLKPSFQELLQKVQAKAETEPAFFSSHGDKPVYVLSDVARAMLDRVASEGNRRNGELAVSLRGTKLKDNIFVIAFVSPASDFINIKKDYGHVVPEIERKKTIEFSQKTNLNELKIGLPKAVVHVHQEQLGRHNIATPSDGDYAQANKSLLIQGANAPHNGIITKTGDQLHINIFDTVRTTTGEFEHFEHCPIITESQLA